MKRSLLVPVLALHDTNANAAGLTRLPRVMLPLVAGDANDITARRPAKNCRRAGA